MRSYVYVVLLFSMACLITSLTLFLDIAKIAEKHKIAKVLHRKHLEKMPVTITVYNATVGQCDNTPFGTADGSVIRPQHPQRWCGVSRDLLKQFPYGTKICLDIPDAPYLSGEWTVHDTGKRSSRNHVDLLISNPDVCYIRGKWKGFIVL